MGDLNNIYKEIIYAAYTCVAIACRRNSRKMMEFKAEMLRTHYNICRDFNTQKRIIFIVHGFTNHFGAQWMHNVKDALLDRVRNSGQDEVSVMDNFVSMTMGGECNSH